MWVIWLSTDNVHSGTIPLFYERDEAFICYAKEVISKKPADSRNPLDKELEVAWYMFSHVIIGINYLSREYSDLRDIDCQNGFKLLVKQPTDGVVLIAGVSADTVGSSMLEVERRLDTLLTILTFLYGPSYDYHLSRKMTLKESKKNWDSISLLLNRWHEALNSEQCYLVEAIEELSIDAASSRVASPADSMDSKFESIMIEARRIIKHRMGCSYDHVIHTMLVVESKIVKFNSSGKDRVLSSYDMLLMLLVTLAYFPSNLIPEDLFAQPRRRAESNATLLEDSEEDLLDDVQTDCEGAQTDRYFVDVMIDEETPTTDTQSMVSTLSDEVAGLTRNSASDGTTLDNISGSNKIGFTLGDNKLQIPKFKMRSETEIASTNELEVQEHMKATAENVQLYIKDAPHGSPAIENVVPFNQESTSAALDHPELQNNQPVDSSPIAQVANIVTNEDISERFNNHTLKTDYVRADIASCDSELQGEQPLVERCAAGQEGAAKMDDHVKDVREATLNEALGDGVDSRRFSVDSNKSEELTSISSVETLKSTEQLDTMESIEGENTTMPVAVEYGAQSTDGTNNCSESQVDGAKDCSKEGQVDGAKDCSKEGQVDGAKDYSNEAQVVGSKDCSKEGQVSVDDPNNSLTFDVSPIPNGPPAINENTESSTVQSLPVLNEIGRARSVTECIYEVSDVSTELSHETSDKILHSQTSSSPASGISSFSGHDSSRQQADSNVVPSRLHTLPKAAARSRPRLASGRKGKDPRRIESMSSISKHASHLEPLRRRHQSLHDELRDSSDLPTDKEEEYYSAPTPPLGGRHGFRRPSTDSVDSYHTAVLIRPKAELEHPMDTFHLLENIQSQTDEAHMSKGIFIHQRVFLRSAQCDYVPACLYVVSISPGINVIVAAEITDPQKPGKFVELLTHLHALLHPAAPPDPKLPTPDRIIDKMADKLRDVFDLIRNRVNVDVHKNAVTDTLSLWQKTVVPLAQFYRAQRREGARCISDTLERNILSIITVLKKWFRALYMTVTDLAADKLDHIHKLQLVANRRLKFYRQILLVKANRNMAMSAFQNEKYPGLVHFIYIYRNKNTMKSPSLQLPMEDNSMQANIIRDMKVRLWRILPWMYKQLSNGSTSISVKDGDFIFSFDLYVYDEVHYRFVPKKISIQSLYTPQKVAIGDLKGQFYDHLLKITDTGAGYKCLELLTVHFAVLPREVITKQRTQLLENELHKKHDPFR